MTATNSAVRPSSAVTLNRWLRLAMTIGPGLVVMFADTEAGSVITAAQSGARWGSRLLLFQFALIPVLYLAQELSARLGMATGKGYGELITHSFGPLLSRLTMAALVISCLGSLVMQMSGMAGLAGMFGIPVWQTVAAMATMIFLMMLNGSYHSLERIAIMLGTFELAFLAVAWNAVGAQHEVLQGALDLPLGNHDFLYLLAANLGTCIMPWTIAYQQSAVVDKGLTAKDMKIAKLDTLGGAVLTQVITGAVLIAAAATFHRNGQATELGSVAQIAAAFDEHLGGSIGHVVFALGLSGGALVATIVVCLTSAWSIGEMLGLRHSLEHHPREAPLFYGSFVLMLAVAGVLVGSGVNLIRLSIAMGVLNALLLPLVLWCLYRLAQLRLPPEFRIKGGYAATVAALFLATGGIGLYTGLAGIFG
jgi:Mn2+/Fe2+ NRAMP family transporter